VERNFQNLLLNSTFKAFPSIPSDIRFYTARFNIMGFTGTLEKCKACDKTVYFIELVSADGVPYHKKCFKCSHCNGLLVVRVLFTYPPPPPPAHAFSFVPVVHVRINEYDLLPGLMNLTHHEIFLIDEQLFLNRWCFILQTSLRPALQGDWQF